MKVTEPLVPPEVAAVTLRAPGVAPAEIENVAVARLELTTLTLLILIPVAASMVIGERKFFPISVTLTVWPCCPETGEMGLFGDASE